jgi:FkbM family methyltransferase
MIARLIRKIAAAPPRENVIKPRGADLFDDLEHCFPGYSPRVLLDVGANIGQSAIALARRFPSADIYSLEPFPAVFAELQSKVDAYPRIYCHNLACGASSGFAFFRRDTDPTMGRLEVRPEHDVAAQPADGTLVKVTTVDAFCSANGLERIGLLKIDTEGGDLDVLRGAECMLSAARIDFVEVEAGMNRDNRYHVPMFELLGFLEDKGYRLFGIYEQIPEWPSGRPFLRRANIVFLSPELSRQTAA